MARPSGNSGANAASAAGHQIVLSLAKLMVACIGKTP